jgi:serine protease
MRLGILFLLVLLGLSRVSAQERAEYVAGEILVQLAPNADVKQVCRDMSQKLGKDSQIRLKRALVAEMQISLLAFDANMVSHDAVLRQLRLHPAVRVAQNNHITRPRLTPNDPMFSQQWQYINTGNSGGLVNADIDIDLAWDITTGGTTPLGDTIVVCIVDDGLDLNHQDILPNLWRNQHEIAANGIDDDGNGYIDDVQGWNAYDNNNNISGGSHGTSVAGIVGAKGNNNIGVSGVNWDVKLMIVNGGGNEAESIEAYTYALRMRRQYNQSGGQLGAYVVATNSSWGTDNLQAVDAPLWCAFYDSLGSVGIVSVGATANRNSDVDVVGDMPTSCASPYLISVTNLRRTDIKEFSAGYGTTTIDLGAYGTDTYTADFGGGYAAFGGTSGATPHVTGTAALIYAAPCLRLATIAQATPDVAALMVKDFILQGVTPNSSLNGITTTNGRLNTNNAVLLAMQSGCAVSGCYTPFGIRSQNVSGNEMTVTWRAVADAQTYLARYRLQGDTTWINTANSNDTFLILTGLTACSYYEVQIAADCDTIFSSYTSSITVKTGDCCNAPTSINLPTITTTTANINWVADAFVQTYIIDYRIVGDTVWQTINSNTNSLSLNNLEPCTNYELQMRSLCAVNVNNNSSNIVRFKTKGCGACEDASYCANTATDATYEWIRRVSVGTMLNNSNSNGGYANFAGIVGAPDLQAGDSIPFEFVGGQNNSSPNWRWRVWADFDQDGLFLQTAELIYDSGNQTGLTVAGNFFLPTTALPGITRLRVSFKWGSLLAQPCDGFNYGEIEDYCINVLAPTAVSQEQNEPQLTAFPNPFGDYIQVNLPPNAQQNAAIHIYNTIGQLVLSQNLADNQPIQSIQTDNLPQGTYFLRVRNAEGKQWTTKLVK